MKTQRTFLILSSLLFCLYTCKKDTTNPGSIVGKWNVVSITNYGVSHAGQPGDYYEFTSNGTLDIKGGSLITLLTYTTYPDSTIDLTFQGDPQALSEWGRITTFTAHSLVIDGPYPISPGGANTVGNSISLSR
jgi:hypothetical protein